MKKIWSILAVTGISLAAAFAFSCSSDKNDHSEVSKCADFIDGMERLHYGKSKPQFCDERDGREYVYAAIGEQIWMAENLNYNAAGSVCYKYDEKYCNIYGKLYSWAAASTVCPKGWRLPSNADWDKLYSYADSTDATESPYSSKTAGKYLKATEGWDDFAGLPRNGEDAFGFAALPGGGGYDYGNHGTSSLAGYYYFYHAGSFGYWSSASEIGDYNAHASIRSIYNASSYASSDIGKRTDLYSVRCVKD